jgi:hypothetical protein
MRFDLFVHNVDRHLRNFLVIKEGNGHSVFSMDYSRSWLHNGFPLPSMPMAADSRTVAVQRWLRQQFSGYFDIGAANRILSDIDSVSSESIQRIIAQQPKYWLTEAQADAIVQWWGSGGVQARTATIRQGMQNGSVF